MPMLKVAVLPVVTALHALKLAPTVSTVLLAVVAIG
jgi:hypothetical protein